jgi:UDP-N-acetylmuramoyl-L-alanyl-D-glutamate--2,6-diaminopimelate ligase
LRAAGIKTGLISTVNAVIGDSTIDTGFHVTTPEASEIQYYLSRMRSAGMTHVLIETTSHGLAQHRVAACDFDIAVITNISHEHLDYHGSFDAYRDAKSKLFIDLEYSYPKSITSFRGAVLNHDDSSYSFLKLKTRVPNLSYGLDNEPDIKGINVKQQNQRLSFTTLGQSLTGVPFSFQVETPLIGFYNISNCLAAITVTRGMLELNIEPIQIGIENLKSIPGRMETIVLGQNFTAIVDFAHTPNALREALKAARKLTNGKIIAVFGSAGLRDREKRRMMAEISAELADYSILTAEDPRSEDLIMILEEMADGIKSKNGVEGENYWRIPDRGEAIRFAVEKAKDGDVVIACGKGHEQSMCFGEIEFPWDDRIAMRAVLCDYLGIPGPQIPYLPTQDIKF